MLGQMPLFASGGGYDPTVLALTGFWRDYTNPAWTGTASAGTSGSNDLQDPGNEPAQGTALNSRGTANFNGTNDYFNIEGTLDTYISGSAFAGWVLLNPDNATAGILWQDPNGKLLLYFNSDTIVLQTNASTVSRAISTGAYSLVTFRYTGSNIQIGVNEVPGAAGGASTAAFSTALTPLTGVCVFGQDGSSADFYDGHVAEIGIIDTTLDDTTFNQIKSYVNSRYALSL